MKLDMTWSRFTSGGWAPWSRLLGQRFGVGGDVYFNIERTGERERRESHHGHSEIFELHVCKMEIVFGLMGRLISCLEVEYGCLLTAVNVKR